MKPVALMALQLSSLLSFWTFSKKNFAKLYNEFNDIGRINVYLIENFICLLKKINKINKKQKTKNKKHYLKSQGLLLYQSHLFNI